MRRTTAKATAGYVMIVALFVLLVTMTAGLLVAASLNHQMRLFRLERQDAELLAMVDGALAMALARLWGNPDYEGTAEPFADGTIGIATRKIDGLTVEVTVRATFWGGGRAARARVRIDRRSPDVRDPPRVLEWEPLPFREAQ